MAAGKVQFENTMVFVDFTVIIWLHATAIGMPQLQINQTFIL